MSTPVESAEGAAATAAPRRAVFGPRVVGAVLLVGGLVLGYVAIRDAGEDGVTIDGPRLAPLVVTAAWVVLAAVYLVAQFVRRPAALEVPAEEESVDVAPHFSGRLTPVLLVGALIAYLLVLEPVGFALASAAFFIAAARILGSRHLLRDTVVGILLAFGVYFAFTTLLDVRLPPGVLPL